MTILKKFKKNPTGRDFVVGDLHGEYTKLMSQLDSLGFDYEEDRLFCCGDLIDRGSESLECIMLIYEPWFFSVRGNHEQMMIDIYVHDQPDGGMWHENGGWWELDHNPSDIKLWASELDYLLPYQIEIDGKVGIVHGDVGSTWKELDESMLSNALWDRARINGTANYGIVKGIDRVYVGHTPTEDKVIIDNVHYMDSGSVFNKCDLRIEEIEI